VRCPEPWHAERRKRAKGEVDNTWEKVKVEVRERVEVKVEVIQTIPAARAKFQERVVVTLLRSDSWELSIFSKPRRVAVEARAAWSLRGREVPTPRLGRRRREPFRA